ncbi:hypothetical protein [Nonomuraea sp. NPDC049758]|uniref:hypothetical protein n=1 Tax=Nonomuraea sp. NPDC049758 TaxID=3154360 RepID=UPI003425AE66
MLIPGAGWTTAATVQALPDIRPAISESAAPGTVTVLACESRSSPFASKRGRSCGGTFVYDATGEAVPVIAHKRADPGDVYAARITADGDNALLRGGKGVPATLTPVSPGLLILGLVLTGLMYFAPVNTLWPFMTATGAAAVSGLVGQVAGFIASNT